MNSTAPMSVTQVVAGILAAGPPVIFLVGMAVGALIVLAYLAERDSEDPEEVS